MKWSIKLKIAEVVIQMRSRFALEQLSEKELKLEFAERFKNFFYKGKQKPHIIIEVEIVNRLPRVTGAKPIFITYHFHDGSENWRLLKKGKSFIYKCPLKNKKQLMYVNSTFERAHAYLLPKKGKGKVWSAGDVIYDFLQVLLIKYLAQRKSGIFTHAIGVKDLDGEGFLFAGKSGCGKSTTARIWHKYSRAMVLNDDRMIIRRRNGKFLIYGSPWHGEFSDYLQSHIESAKLEKLFFIHHAKQHTLRRISQKKTFAMLYPTLFPTFWDKQCLKNIASFCQDLIESMPCYSLGFANNRTVIGFVRKI